MTGFRTSLGRLVAPIDRRAYPAEAAELERCASVDELARLAARGWLSPPEKEPRLKLVRHGSGTYLVVAYDRTGWSVRVSMESFGR